MSYIAGLTRNDLHHLRLKKNRFIKRFGILLLQDLAFNKPSDFQAPYHIFYSEWRAFLGPNSDEPMAPVQPNMEAMVNDILQVHACRIWKRGPLGSRRTSESTDI